MVPISLSDIPSSHQIKEGSGNCDDQKQAGHHTTEDEDHPPPIAEARYDLSGLRKVYPVPQALDKFPRGCNGLERPGKMRLKFIQVLNRICLLTSNHSYLHPYLV